LLHTERHADNNSQHNAVRQTNPRHNRLRAFSDGIRRIGTWKCPQDLPDA
jgi:hypothetical protein